MQINNIKWISLAQMSRVLIQILGMTVVARLIGPDIYGQMAVALSVATFALVIRDLGLNAAIIRKNDVDEVFLSTISWLSFFFGILLFCFIFFISGYAANYYKLPDLEILLTIIALSFPVSSFSLTRQALLERQEKFHIVAFIEVGAQIFGVVCAIVIALYGEKKYALPLQFLGSSFIMTMLYCFWGPKIKIKFFDIGVLSGIFSFSIHIMSFNIINYATRNLDIFIIAKSFGAFSVGVYSLAYKVMLFPVANISTVANRAMLPFASKIKENNVLISEVYLESMKIVSVLAALIMSLLWVVRYDFSNIFIGKEWENALPDVLFFLAPVGLIQAMCGISSSFFVALGETKKLMFLGLISSVAQLVGFLIGSYYNLEVFLKIFLFCSILNLMINFYFVSNLLGVAIIKIFHSIYPSVVVAFTAVILSILIDGYVAINFNGLSRFIFVSCIFVLVYFCGVFFFFGRGFFVKIFRI